MRVKVIQALNEESLEEKINAFLECNETHINVINIKYQTSPAGCYIGHYAMIIYEFK